MEWLTRCFEPETCEKAAGEYRLLICDGHDSHITGEWVAHCMDNDIILAILPPHSSHLTQPLDVGVFGPLKKYMAAEIDHIIRLGISRIQKVEWLAAFVAAHDRALSTKIYSVDFMVPVFIHFCQQKSFVVSQDHYH